jgi:phage shock protein A
MRLLKEKEALESKINSFEQQLQEISLSLQNPAQTFEEIAALGRQYSQLEQELNQALEAWAQFEI